MEEKGIRRQGNIRANGVGVGEGVVLSTIAQSVWKRAGQPDPIKPTLVAKTVRNIALELHFLDRKAKVTSSSNYS